jgi:hypothetical protein
MRVVSVANFKGFKVWTDPSQVCWELEASKHVGKSLKRRVGHVQLLRHVLDACVRLIFILHYQRW